MSNVATTTEAETQADLAPGSKFSAMAYEPFLWLGERAGMTARRRRIVQQAGGSVLELGAGTGLNVPHYRDDLDRLVLSEPEPNMAERLRKKVAAVGSQAEVVRAPGELLPFEDESFDSIVGTLVLCTVHDPEAAISEAKRVLKPGGSYFLIEHVRADTQRLASWQDRLKGPWAAFAAGCVCNQDTKSLLADGGFDVSALDDERWRRVPPLVKPLIIGEAQKSS